MDAWLLFNRAAVQIPLHPSLLLRSSLSEKPRVAEQEAISKKVSQ